MLFNNRKLKTFSLLSFSPLVGKREDKKTTSTKNLRKHPKKVKKSKRETVNDSEREALGSSINDVTNEMFDSLYDSLLPFSLIFFVFSKNKLQKKFSSNRSRDKDAVEMFVIVER